MSNLSEEEKKAINQLASYQNKLVYEITDKDKKAVKTVLNLIEKLQKEIEKQQEINKWIGKRIDELEEYVENGYADKEDLRELYVLQKIFKWR